LDRNLISSNLSIYSNKFGCVCLILGTNFGIQDEVQIKLNVDV